MPPTLLTVARPTAPWHRRFGLGLLLAMLLVQQAGLFHRYLHGAAGVGNGIAVVQGLDAMQVSVKETGGLPLHDKTACMLLDQSCVADALPALAVALVAVMPMAAFCVPSLQAFLPRWSVPFQARGPPFSL